MYVHRVTELEDLVDYRLRWDELCDDQVFRSWTWLTTWWRHYGQGRPGRELAVLLVFEGDQPSSATGSPCRPGEVSRLAAILPTYTESSLARGRVMRLLGDGEVCSDHLGLLVPSDVADRVAQAISRYLATSWPEWDLLDLAAVDADDSSLQLLIAAMRSHGCQVSLTSADRTWAVELPDCWDEFLARQSKSHRKQLHRLQTRVLETGQAIWQLAETAHEFEVAWPVLVDLHQRRRNSLGEPGCFASDRWARFHRDVAWQLFCAARLRLSWLELGGRPVAAEYHLAGNRTTFAYQGGIDPGRLAEQPGRLSMICSLQHAMAEGHRQFDLLRGDEAYKAHWRAVPRDTHDIQVVPARHTARWRYQAWSCFRRASSLARSLATSH